MRSPLSFTALNVLAVSAGISLSQTSPPQPGGANGHVYVCTGQNYTQQCINLGFVTGVCYNFLQSPGWDNAISSVSPDPGWVCVFYVDYDCIPDQGIVSVSYPGDGTLPIGDKAFSSYKCGPN